ncbi:MAG TPA: hypothetical protein PK129_11395 [Cellvibrionaceae bacterium]|nr:hypothetical protein [Cellvibrionaceae bacterium]
MVVEDIELSKKIFELVSNGICENYDSFYYESYVYDSYIVENMSTTINDVENWSVKTDFNGALISKYMRQLWTNSEKRGERWCGFVMKFKKGGDVKIKFVYEYPAED